MFSILILTRLCVSFLVIQCLYCSFLAKTCHFPPFFLTFVPYTQLYHPLPSWESLHIPSILLMELCSLLLRTTPLPLYIHWTSPRGAMPQERKWIEKPHWELRNFSIPAFECKKRVLTRVIESRNFHHSTRNFERFPGIPHAGDKTRFYMGKTFPFRPPPIRWTFFPYT